MAELSPPITMKFMINSPTLLNVPSLLTVCMKNPSTARAVADIMKRCIVGGDIRVLGKTSYLCESGNARLKASLPSYLGILTLPPTARIQ